MKHITSKFIRQHPECMTAKGCLDLMVYLAKKEPVGSLSDLLSYTKTIENEYCCLQRLRLQQPDTGKP